MVEKAKLVKKEDKKKAAVMTSRTWLGSYKLLLLRLPFWLRERQLFQWFVFFTLMFPYMFHVSFDELDADGDDDFDADDVPMFLGVKRRSGKKAKNGNGSNGTDNRSPEEQPLKAVQRVKEPPHTKIQECGHFMDERRWWCKNCKALIEMDCGHFMHEPQPGCAGCEQKTIDCKPTPHPKDKIDPYCSTCADWEDAQGVLMVRKTKERPFQKEKGKHEPRVGCSHFRDEFKFWCRNCWTEPQLACGHFVDDKADPTCEVCEVVRATILSCGHYMGKAVDGCKRCVEHEKSLEESSLLWKRAAQAVRNVYVDESPAIHARRNKEEPAIMAVWQKPIGMDDKRKLKLEQDLRDAIAGKAPEGKKMVAFEGFEVDRFQKGLLALRGWDTTRQPPGFNRPVRCDFLLDAIHAMKGKTDLDCGHLTDKPNPKCQVCRAQKGLVINPCYHRRDQLQKHCPHCEFIREVLSAKIDEEEYSPRQMKKAFPYFIVGESACVFILWLTMAFWATWKVSTSGAHDIIQGNMLYYDQRAGKKNFTRIYFWDLKAGLETFREHTFELGVFGPHCEDYRWSFWRWFGYQFSHVGANHVCMNVLMNLLLGIPLEMVECQDTEFDPSTLPPEDKRTEHEKARLQRYNAIKENPVSPEYVDVQENAFDGSFYVLRTLPTGNELEAKFAPNGAPAWFEGDLDEIAKNWVRDPDKVCCDDLCPCMKISVDEARREKRGMRHQNPALIEKFFNRNKDCHLPNCPACKDGKLKPEEESFIKIPQGMKLPIHRLPRPTYPICHFPCCPCYEEDPRKKVLPQPYVNACPPGALIRGHGIMAFMFQVGVFGGACCHMFNDAHTPVVGCSGGTYSLIGMNLANLAMNWNETKFRIPKLIMLALMVFAEFFCFAMSVGETEVSNSAHAGGAVAGFIIGVLVGRNFSAESGHEDKKQASSERIFKGAMLGLGIVLIIWSFTWMWTQSGARSIWEAMKGEHAWCWTQQIFDPKVSTEDFFCVRCGNEPGCIDHWMQYKNHADVDYKKECDGVGYKSTKRGYHYDGR